MGGAQFFWRVTLLEGEGMAGIYRLEEHSIQRGASKPIKVPYQERVARLPYEKLATEIPYIGDEVAQAVLPLSQKGQQAEFYHDRYMPI